MIAKLILVIILVSSLFLRTHRLSDMLGFWYDQGRDAKVVWQILHDRKLTLIGPTTGIEGIFLGPFYYYLLTPLYFIGNGNPLAPAVGMALFSVAAIYLIYRIGKEYISTSTGLLAAGFYAFSFEIVTQNRWLANPSPLPFFALLAIWCLLKIVTNKSAAYHWLGLGLCLGLSLQLEAASAVFFLPATLLTLVIFRKSITATFHQLLHLFFAFSITLLPQLVFNIRHDQVLFIAFRNFLITNSSFQVVPVDFLLTRLHFYLTTFTKIIYPDVTGTQFFLPILLLFFLLAVKKLSRRIVPVLLIILFTPLVLLLFYHGNNGYVWDYYFVGVFPVFILLLATLIVVVYKSYWWSRAFIFLLVFVIIFQNLTKLHTFFSASLPAYVTLTPIIRSVDYVYADAKGQPFNVDVYVPPVISHSFDYVFLWRGTNYHNTLPSNSTVPLLYTLLEPDQAKWRGLWLDRQNGLSTVNNEASFGPILVQKRTRK